MWHFDASMEDQDNEYLGLTDYDHLSGPARCTMSIYLLETLQYLSETVSTLTDCGPIRSVVEWVASHVRSCCPPALCSRERVSSLQQYGKHNSTKRSREHASRIHTSLSDIGCFFQGSPRIRRQARPGDHCASYRCSRQWRDFKDSYRAWVWIFVYCTYHIEMIYG